MASGFAAVFVNYTQPPDAQYPQAVNEIYAATKWVAEHGEEIDVDGKNLAVVGGNMTAVTTLMAKAKGGPHIRLQIMMWSLVDADFETNSYKEFGEKRFLTTSLMKWKLRLRSASKKERSRRVDSDCRLLASDFLFKVFL